MITRREARGETKQRSRARSNTVGRESLAFVAVDRPREIRVEADAAPVSSHRSTAWQHTFVSISLSALLAAGCLMLAFLLENDAFRAGRLRITGASGPVAAQVATTVSPACQPQSPPADDQLLESLGCSNEGQRFNLFQANTADIQDRIQRLPAIASASVRMQLPDLVVVNITERQPESAWVVGPTVFRVAADGTVIDQGPPQGLQVAIGDIDGTPVQPGDRVDPAIIKLAETLQDRLPRDFGFHIDRIQYSASEGLAVIGDQGVIVMFGNAEDLELKMVELQRIAQLAKDKKTPLSFVDLRYKTPYYRAR